MQDIAAARRYARALFSAVPQESVEIVEKELRKVYQLIRSNHELERLLSHFLISALAKKKALRQALESEAIHLSAEVLRFFELLITKKRMPLLPLLISDFAAAMDESQNTLKAHVRSAAEMDAGSRLEMEKKLSRLFGKKVQIEVSVHPELLAGVIVKANDFVLDGSLKSKIMNLKSSLNRG